MNLWGRAQDAQHWTIFRYNNLSHSTLVVDGQYQRVNGSAPIICFSDEKSFPHVVFDMSSVYEGQLEQALRGASLLPSGQVVIQDEFKAADKPVTVRWAMVTPAEVHVESGNDALLTEGGKTMRLTVLTDRRIKWQTWSTEPKADYDASNPGTCLIGFEVSLSSGQAARTAVVMTPSSAKAKPRIDIKPLSQWSSAQ
jgi:hypothetical protein